jgi:succinate dehydrogenase / fumarate reductase, flavoprotein subunit
MIDARIPSGPLDQKWTLRRRELSLVAPARRRQLSVVVVGSGLAGASAASTLSELGYKVLCLCIQDSPRRAHSVAAQGGINAAKDYHHEGDSVERLFFDTIKGGDYRSREANVFRLAEISSRIIDHCVAQGVPFAREYGGLLANRSFGGALVSRTFYSRGQTGQQLLLGAYQALEKEAAGGGLTLLPRREVLDLVVVAGRARGVVTRDLVHGTIETHLVDAVVLATGGYANCYWFSTNAGSSNASAIWRAHRRGAAFANPSFVQFHPTCLPERNARTPKLALVSESLRNDARVWVPKSPGDARSPESIPEPDRDYYLERSFPKYGNLVPRDIGSRAAKAVFDEGRGVGSEGRAVYLDLSEALARLGEDALLERYGNVLEMVTRLTGRDPLRAPIEITPGAHYTMGGLWVDYDLMSTIPGLFVIGEANFSDHGANRLGASALMQALADGTFIAPLTIAAYLAGASLLPVSPSSPEVIRTENDARSAVERLTRISGRTPAAVFHRRLGEILWRSCGLSRNGPGLTRAIGELRELREELWSDLAIPGTAAELNQELERAGRVADFVELGELMCMDALAREESCGSHFREEHQTGGEPRRDDARFAHVAIWSFAQEGRAPTLHKEPLTFEALRLAERSYR